METPPNLLAAVRYFKDPDNCLKYVAAYRWPNGVECPTCGRKDVRFLAKQRSWECRARHPRKQFTVKVGTLLEDSPIGLDSWLPAMWMIANCRNGISSYEIHRNLGVTQKTAWFILHRIREAMPPEMIEKMEGPVEVDEAFVGGKAHSVDENPETGKLMPTGPQENKTIVMGIVQRKGKARAFVIEDTKRETLHGKIIQHVAERATIYTDSLKSYGKLTAFTHFTINHSKQYVNGHIHTNGVENFWMLLKRTIKGTYVCPRPWHLQRYVEEQIFRGSIWGSRRSIRPRLLEAILCLNRARNRRPGRSLGPRKCLPTATSWKPILSLFRFNECGGNDAFRFSETVKQIVGKRLTYKALTATVDMNQARTRTRQKMAAIKRFAATA